MFLHYSKIDQQKVVSVCSSVMSTDSSFFFFFTGNFKCAIKEEVTLTSGEWEVLSRHGSKVNASGKAV